MQKIHNALKDRLFILLEFDKPKKKKFEWFLGLIFFKLKIILFFVMHEAKKKICDM